MHWWLEETGDLELLHARIYENCAAELEMYVTKENEKYVVNEIDCRDPGFSTKCMCSFDLYCKIPEIGGDEITLLLRDEEYVIDLKDSSGTIIIDTTWILCFKTEN
ncbi:MAG: hypothetical protein GF398_10450 [Chitinivibrionales bacterium]|nr:hypothetical protein [Chitinivibrionales bacterium]